MRARRGPHKTHRMQHTESIRMKRIFKEYVYFAVYVLEKCPIYKYRHVSYTCGVLVFKTLYLKFECSEYTLSIVALCTKDNMCTNSSTQQNWCVIASCAHEICGFQTRTRQDQENFFQTTCSLHLLATQLMEAGQLLQDGRAGRSRGGDPGASEPADVHL